MIITGALGTLPSHSGPLSSSGSTALVPVSDVPASGVLVPGPGPGSSDVFNVAQPARASSDAKKKSFIVEE